MQLGTAIVFIGICYLCVVSPGFRWLTAAVVVLIFLAALGYKI
jgi:hypothetical protein